MTNINNDGIHSWVETHKVYSTEITLKIVQEIGYFEKVELLRTVPRMVGTGYKNYLYVIDHKWLVTVSSNIYSNEGFYDSYKIEDYTKIVAQQKVFGQRVARLSKKAHVPWNVALLAGHIESDEEAISILKKVRSTRGTASEKLQWELSCGIVRRTAALEELLGDTYNKLDCSGQKKTTNLANYLLGD